MSLVVQLEEAKQFILKQIDEVPKVSIVLGSGLGGLLNEMETQAVIPYSKIPHVQPSTVVGHEGEMRIGRIAGVSVACMRGRLHYYEGYHMSEVVFPFRALAWLGIPYFILTNAAGAMDPEARPGQLVLIKDHINMMGANPLTGPNVAELGVRFPDMSRAYDPELRALSAKIAKKIGLQVREGVYLGIHGPSYETPAEIKAYHRLGADLVGMSTVPEAIALNHMNKRVLGISCITNLAAGVASAPLDHDDVLKMARKEHPEFARWLMEIIRTISTWEA